MPFTDIEEIPATSCLDPAIIEAYGVLEARPLSKELALKLGQLQGSAVLDLLALAHKVKTKFTPPDHVCTILNAKSGACPEDCKFCSQSSHHATDIEEYHLMSKEELLAAAKTTCENGVASFGIVTSGTGYSQVDREFQTIIDSIQAIHESYPDLNVCASLGILAEENVKALAEAGIAHYNINLQVSPGKYATLISTTHAIESRIKTIELLQHYGIKTCTGGILGLGETMADRIDMAFALKELDVDVIPLNVLIPLEGTAMENQPDLPVSEIAKTFAIFRLIHPMKTIKFAAGRETKMKDFQGLLMLAGANGLLTGGYLTTRGREVEDDMKFIEGLKSFE